MSQKTLTLPFVTKTPANNEPLSYPAELACIVCLAESQRKKPSFLRDSSEKTAFISKVHYPLWILPAENSFLVVDGVTSSAHSFSYDAPSKTAAFIEDLKRNSASPQAFMEALRVQAKETKTFSSPSTFSFPAAITDKDVLGFFLAYFSSGTIQDLLQETIPASNDLKAAEDTKQTFENCLRTVEADAKGLGFALAVLKEELEFHTNAASIEIQLLHEKLEAQTAVLKPIVDEAVKELTLKKEKAVTTLQKSLERKLSALDRRRETYMHKLQVAERRRDAAKAKMESAKKRKKAPKSSSGSFALKKYEREVDNVKKEVKAATEQLEKLKKEGENGFRQKSGEFQRAIAAEEGKLIQLNAQFTARISEKQRQIEEMTAQAASITSNFQNRIDDLKRGGFALRSQVLVNFKLDDPDEAVFAQLPVYLVKFVNGEEERYTVVSPVEIAEEIGVLGELKSMFSRNPDPKLKTLTRPANKKLHEALTAELVGKIQSDHDFRIKLNELCRASNLIDQNMFGQTLNEGLDEIEKKGWITHEEAATMCKRALGDLA